MYILSKFKCQLNLSKVCGTQSCCSSNRNKSNSTRKTNVNKELKIRKESSIWRKTIYKRTVLDQSVMFSILIHYDRVVHCLIYFLDHFHRTPLKLDICWTTLMYYKNSIFSTRKKTLMFLLDYMCGRVNFENN